MHSGAGKLTKLTVTTVQDLLDKKDSYLGQTLYKSTIVNYVEKFPTIYQRMDKRYWSKLVPYYEQIMIRKPYFNHWLRRLQNELFLS